MLFFLFKKTPENQSLFFTFKLSHLFLIYFHVCIVHRTYIAHWWASTGSPTFLRLSTIKKDWQSEYLEAIGAVHQRTFINNLFYRKLKTRIRFKSVAIAFVEFQIPSVRWSTIQQTLFPVFIFLSSWLMYYRLFCVELWKTSTLVSEALFTKHQLFMEG